MTPDQMATVWRILAALFLVWQVGMCLAVWSLFQFAKRQLFAIDVIMRNAFDRLGDHHHDH